ncbi:beta strand repeat-containing protein [Microcella sp.]|uniref:beta strand repeat-containing protein n=1 Tax=Microcella sp. TaxID=1913979 RepID=UPI002568C931|nr:hypothetical protein [Microcella sp.]MBX9472231.1 hypothetical protein [Microcella sp.]
MTRSSRRRPLTLSATTAAFALVVGGLVVLPASPASAVGVSDFAALESQLAAGNDVELTADISSPASTLAVPENATLDLAGFDLATDAVSLATGVSFTVTDSGSGGTWIAEATADADAGFENTGATLTIDGGTITADGGNLGAGIGGDDGASGGTLVVNGGAVTARNSGIFFGGTGYAAGIGGGADGGGGTVTITGGTVSATGGSVGAGIGGSNGSTLDGGVTTISGGSVTAVGGGSGAGIGGGFLQDGGTISISGATTTVTVVTGRYAAGIGGGRSGAGGDITIDGGTVSVTTAVADDTGAAIGGGERGAGGTITINGGTITANATRVGTNYTGSAGIGSGDASLNNSGQSGIVTGTEAAGGTITINGGTVTARGSGGGAGIGGGDRVSGWIVEINGGTVNAYGGEQAAGIGGGNRGNGGDISINGGTVNAYGGEKAAGIGGGDGFFSGGGGGTIAITSEVSAPTVYARSGTYGAGIGGGELGGSSAITIGEGTSVTADGGLFGPAIGRGINGDPSTWSVSGTLTLPANSFVTVFSGESATVTETGVVRGAGSVGVASGATLLNNGIITNTSVGPQNLVLDHSYRFEFDGNFAGSDPIDAVEVFAPTFQSGERELPTPTRPGFFLSSWNTVSDGSGSTVTPTSTIAAGGTLYAQWTTDPLAVIPATDTVTAGGDIEFLIQDRSDGDLDVTSVSTVTTGEASDIVTTKTDGLIEFTLAGERLITATLDSDSAKTGTTMITVLADTANPDGLEATPSATTVNEGGSITFDFALLDPYGNPFPVPGEVVLTSDVATDVIDGNTVSFPTASVHTITASYDGFETTVEITVIAASDLAATGADPAVPLGLAGLLLTLGAVLLLARRRAVV